MGVEAPSVEACRGRKVNRGHERLDLPPTGGLYPVCMDNAVISITGTEADERLSVTRAAVLDFFQATCPPCRVLEPQLARVAQEFRDTVPTFQIDIDRDLPVAERFGVRSIPTVLLVASGGEIGRLDGLITESDLRGLFTRGAALSRQ